MRLPSLTLRIEKTSPQWSPPRRTCLWATFLSLHKSYVRTAWKSLAHMQVERHTEDPPPHPPPRPPDFEPIYSICRQMARSTSATPERGAAHLRTPRIVGPSRQTFWPPVRGRQCRRRRQHACCTICKWYRWKTPPPSPLDFHMSDTSSRPQSTVDTASTISCDTEGPECPPPPPALTYALNGCVLCVIHFNRT